MVRCRCGWDSDKDSRFVKWHRSLKKDFPHDKKEIGIYCPECRKTGVLTTLEFHIQDQIEEVKQSG